MDRSKNKCRTGSKGFERSAQGLARWSACGTAGMTAPSSSYCYTERKRGTAGVSAQLNCYYKIGTWNVRSLNVLGKLANVLQEMNRLEVDVLGVRETF